MYLLFIQNLRILDMGCPESTRVIGRGLRSTFRRLIRRKEEDMMMTLVKDSRNSGDEGKMKVNVHLMGLKHTLESQFPGTDVCFLLGNVIVPTPAL